MNGIYEPIKPHSKINIISIYSFYNLCFPKNFRFDGERHNFWELAYIVDGEVGITSEEELYSCKAGDLIIHKPNAFHTCWNIHKSNMKIFTITFNGNGLDSTLFHGKIKLDAKDRELIDALIEETKQCFHETDGEYYYNSLQYEQLKVEKDFQILKNYLEILCIKIGKYAEKLNIHLENHSEQALKYKKIVLYLNKNVRLNLTIEKISKDLFESPSNLKRLFHKFANCGIINYYNNLRIDYAIKLLCEGKRMNEIANEMNFSSQNYFSSFFKKHMGIAPIAYQKKITVH